MSVLDSSFHRLLIVTRRFWPFSEDQCHRLLHWGCVLHEKGILPRILTARWNASWPDTMEIRHIPVHRLLPAPHSNWNEAHLQKNMVQWIHLHVREFDAVYVDRADTLMQILTNKGTQWNLPIICRFAPHESLIGSAPAARLATQASAEACKKCKAIVVTNPADHRYLISQGVPDSNIFRIEDPPTSWLHRTPESRVLSRRNLANLSGDFVVPNRTPVITHIGSTDWVSLRHVLDSVCDLLDGGGILRFWIINPNISYSVIHDYLKDRGWHREVLIFDGFDCLEELAQAADLLWVSNPMESAQFTWPLFLAASVPVIVRETEGPPSLLTDLTKGRTYGSPTDLALQLHHWYANQEAANENASKLRNQLASHYNSVDVTRVWTDLFRRVCDRSKT